MSSDTCYGGATNNMIRADGMSYGVGVDFLVGERMLLCAEFQRRTTGFDAGDMGGFPKQSNDHDVHSLTVRLGMTF